MSPRQEDYGSSGSTPELVPGSLRVFRHFLVDSKTGEIQPMNYTPDAATFFNKNPQKPYARRTPTGWHVAHCTKGDIIAQWDMIRRNPAPGHDAPRVDCTCGFYASYSQETDFYPSFRWGRDYVRLAMGEAEWETKFLVRAVCEVSGTVVMGRKGVRAGKIKIKAMAVDWSKRMQVGPRVLRYDDVWVTGHPSIPDTPGYHYRRDENGVLRCYANEDEADEVEAVNETAANVAFTYGVELFDSVKAMHEAYPEEDVSHLVDTSPATDPDEQFYAYLRKLTGVQYGKQAAAQAFTAQTQQMQQQMQQFARASAQAIRGVTASLAFIDDAMVEAIAEDEKPKSQFERAIEAKKSRPAPPGSGIDRRRGRVR